MINRDVNNTISQKSQFWIFWS